MSGLDFNCPGMESCKPQLIILFLCIFYFFRMFFSNFNILTGVKHYFALDVNIRNVHNTIFFKVTVH